MVVAGVVSVRGGALLGGLVVRRFPAESPIMAGRARTKITGRELLAQISAARDESATLVRDGLQLAWGQD
jgi:hypothetical protein